jgi:hypothetical protein
MEVSDLAKAFFDVLDKAVGPFDRPMRFHIFPFGAGGAVNFLTVGAGRCKSVKYVTWDLLGDEGQKHGRLGRYEILTQCDDNAWCLNVITNLGRLGLSEKLEPGETVDIGAWVDPKDSLQGVALEEALSVVLGEGRHRENCGLLRCIGITRPELEFARQYGVEALFRHLRRADIYPRTITKRRSVDLS